MKNSLNKKVQFIPGLGEKPSDHKALSKYLNIVNVDWNTGKIKPPIKKSDILTGFSMGAILACEYTIKNKVKTLVLCSLTPGAETLKEVNANEVIFLVGEKEKWCLKEIRRVSKTLKCKKSIIIVLGADHKITGEYQKKLIEVIQKVQDK